MQRCMYRYLLKKIMKHTLIVIISVFSFIPLTAQNDDVEYMKVLTQRADKIVKTLGIEDKTTYDNVVKVIAEQYKNLGVIHDNLDAQTKEVKKGSEDKLKKEEIIQNLKNDTEAKLYNLHCSYIGALSSYLTNDQVEKVKDGMTYGVVKVTYDSYLDMIPTLKPEEKRQLYAWLVEAREHAMSASSSKDKHGWFGKYKGRFNNYLSTQGYDIQKERNAWEERLKQKEQSK